jgi:hypothetical protein
MAKTGRDGNRDWQSVEWDPEEYMKRSIGFVVNNSRASSRRLFGRYARPVFAAATCLAVTLGQAEAKCHRERIMVGPGLTNVETRWTVEKNSACRGRISGVHVITDNFRVVQRPGHGIAGTNGSITEKGFAYNPEPDFLGHDHFRVVADAHDMRRNGGETQKLVVNVDVDVVDKR